MCALPVYLLCLLNELGPCKRENAKVNFRLPHWHWLQHRDLRYKVKLTTQVPGQDRTGGLQNWRRLTGHDVGYDIRIEKAQEGFNILEKLMSLTRRGMRTCVHAHA